MPVATPELKSKPMPVACFAPPLTDEKLTRYSELAESLPDSRGEVRDAMRECLAAVKAWWELDESEGSPKDQSLSILHGPSPEQRKERIIKMRSLDKPFRDKLFDLIPWEYELDAMGRVFDRLNPVAEKELRDAAYHLLWFCRELCLDREPLTQDVLK